MSFEVIVLAIWLLGAVILVLFFAGASDKERLSEEETKIIFLSSLKKEIEEMRKKDG